MSRHFSLLSTGTLFVALYAASALAHDPQERQLQSSKPDCAATKNMDASQIDMQGQVARAIYRRCQAAMDHEDMTRPEEDSSGHSDGHIRPH